MGLLNRIGNAAGRAVEEAQRRAAEARRKAAEAARRAAEAAKRAAERAAKKAAAEAAKKAAEVQQRAAERQRDVFEDARKAAAKVAKTARNAARGGVERAGAAAREGGNRVEHAARKTVDRAEDAARTAAQGIERGARKTVDRAEDAARTAAQGVAHAVRDGAEHLAGAASDVQSAAAAGYRTAVRAGEAAAGEGLEAMNEGWQARGDAVRGVLDRGLSAAALGLEKLENVTPDFADGAIAHAGAAVKLAERGLDAADDVQEAIGGAALALGKAGTAAAGNVLLDPMGSAQALGRGVLDTANMLRIEDNVGNLGPGDTYELKASIDGSAAGVAGRLQGAQRVRRNEDGTLSLSVSGQAGAGLMSRMGTPAAGGEASAFVNGGATVEFKFENEAELAEAMRSFMGPVGGGLSGLLDGGPTEALEGAVADPELLRRNVSAVEFSGGISGELAGKLGIGTAAGLDGQLSGKGDVAARIEFDGGRPSELVLRQSANVSASGSASAPGAGASAGAAGRVTVEERFELPRDLAPMDLATRPRDAVEGIVRSAVRTGQLSLTLAGSASAQADGAGGSTVSGLGGASGQMEAQLKFTGSAADVLESGGLHAALAGDFKEAMVRLAPVVEAEATLTPVTARALGVNVAGGDGLNSAGFGLNARTSDRHAPILQERGTLSEAHQVLLAAIRREQLSVELFG